MPPEAGNDALATGSVTAHGPLLVAAACDTVNVSPAIVMVPLREAALVFAATENETDPSPVPDAPAVTVIQLAFEVAAHAQPEGATTLVEPVPPDAATESLDVASEKVQDGAAAPACVIVNVSPAIVSVPLLDDVLVFAATDTSTVPSPVPEAPLVTVSQLAFDVAVHAQPEGAVTVVFVAPPEAATDTLEEESEKAHVGGGGGGEAELPTTSTPAESA